MELMSLDGLQKNILYSLDYENYYMKKDENSDNTTNVPSDSQESNNSENSAENTIQNNKDNTTQN